MVLIGKPGTWSGLVLRIGQCAFAASSIGVMVSALGFSSFTAFCYLIASMGLQVLWSFGIACLDVYALRRKRSLQNPILVSLFFVGDWVTATLSLAAACSSAGIIVLYARDLGVCKFQAQLPCGKFHTSIALAFVTWALIAGFRHFTIYSFSAIYMATRRDVKWQSGDRRSEATASETGEEVQKP